MDDRPQHTSAQPDLPEGSVDGTLRGLLRDVGAVLRERGPARFAEPLADRGVAQPAGDDAAAADGPREVPASPLREAVRLVHPDLIMAPRRENAADLGDAARVAEGEARLPLTSHR